MKDLWTRTRYPRFKKGEVVALTKGAVRAGLKFRGSNYGFVTSMPTNRVSVNVRRMDQRRSGRYFAGFWRHTTLAERAALEKWWRANR